MKHSQYTQKQQQTSYRASQPSTPDALVTDETKFIPSPDEVARKAYFTYVNQGSGNGKDVQHWLAAEKELIAERNLTRTHGFHNRT
jgi:hypothetical protein